MLLRYIIVEANRRGGISWALTTRAGYRRGRRTRNLRHRPSRWRNRKRKVPVLTANGWTYQKADVSSGEDATRNQNTFNRVSSAKFKDPRYSWERLPRTRTNQNQKKRWRRTRIEHQHVAENGWVAPSLMSRVFNIETWTRRLCAIYPITQLAIEAVKFDVHLLQKPEVHGKEYQRGTLWGREIREYLLELTGRKCAYCGAKGTRLEIEHIKPKARGGSSCPDNLTMACRACNQKKGNLWGEALREQLGDATYKKVQAAAKKSEKGLSDATAINTIRWKLYETLKATGLPVISGTGGKTAYHRTQAGLPKTHYYDAASVAQVPKAPKHLSVAVIKAVGYGRRDLYKFQCSPGNPGRGFNYGYKKVSAYKGFQKYDHIRLKKKKRVFEGLLYCFYQPKGKARKREIEVNDWTEKTTKRPKAYAEAISVIQKRDGYSYTVKTADTRTRQENPTVTTTRERIPQKLTTPSARSAKKVGTRQLLINF